MTSSPCSHLDQADLDVKPSGDGCVECLESGGRWVHLRMCESCGHVGCCDSSPNKHASKHAATNEDHPLVQSFEPGENWWWCYLDEVAFSVPQAPSYSHS